LSNLESQAQAARDGADVNKESKKNKKQNKNQNSPETTTETKKQKTLDSVFERATLEAELNDIDPKIVNDLLSTIMKENNQHNKKNLEIRFKNELNL
jgi:chorismate mutase